MAVSSGFYFSRINKRVMAFDVFHPLRYQSILIPLNKADYGVTIDQTTLTVVNRSYITWFRRGQRARAYSAKPNSCPAFTAIFCDKLLVWLEPGIRKLNPCGHPAMIFSKTYV